MKNLKKYQIQETIMDKKSNYMLTPYSRKLRRDMTSEERKLWYLFLRKLDVTINRQMVFHRYIIDFYCSAAKIAIEIDGSQHYEETGRNKDVERDSYLKSKGITVLRYSNKEINCSFDDVCASIFKELSDRIPVKFKR